jgi:hypothetical protein
MLTKDNWRYVSRAMFMKGFTIYAIQETLKNMGYDIPLRTLYSTISLRSYCSCEVPPDYEDFISSGARAPAKFEEPLTVFQVVWDILGYKDEMFDYKIDPTSDFATFGPFSAIYVEDTIPFTDFVWYPQNGNGSGLRSYLTYERKTNRSMQ